MTMSNIYKEALLLKYGELILKGLNKTHFESLLMSDLKYRMSKCGNANISRAQSTIYVTGKDCDFDIDKALVQACRVMGIASVCRALELPKDMDIIKQNITKYTSEQLKNAKSFKVVAKRSDKDFPLKSPEICDICGGELLCANPHIKVDVHNPDVTVYVEIRDFGAYIHCNALQGAGGMPLGSAGKGVLLLSGGIDSPVAGYMMAKRGVNLEALHFDSYPYTSERALEKVKDLASIMQEHCGRIHLTAVSVTKIQEEIRDNCREDCFTLILRRFMMRIAKKLALFINHGCIITGECLGQVASQTMGAMTVTGEVVADMPVFRPLIALDKEEIVKIARKIDTFETSILPYEDCCTVFTPRHPVTNPKLEMILKEEAKIDVEGLVNEAFENRRCLKI